MRAFPKIFAIGTDYIKDIFKNDSDPFNDFSATNTYRIKLKLIPPTDEPSDRIGINNYLEETMISEDSRDR